MFLHSTNNNKETFRLLDMSSGTDSDILQIEIAQPKRKRVHRKHRPRPGAPGPAVDGNRSLTADSSLARRVGFLIAAAAAFVWLLGLTWLAAALHSQLSTIDHTVNSLSLSSQGVGDALQRCHSAARDLRNNHTELASRLDRLAARQDNISHQLEQMQMGLTAVQQRLAGSSELTTAELGKSVARFGSQISDLDTRAQALKNQAAAALTQQNSLTEELKDIKVQIEKLSNTSVSSVAESSKKDLEPIINKQTEIATILTDLGRNVTSINETLATKISWATVDISKNKNFISSLQESLQNNSASLSSLQTAWKDSNDVLTKNITILNSDMSTKLEDYYKQLSELKQSQVPLNKVSPVIVPEEVTKVQNLSMIPNNDTKPVADTEAIKSLHERDSSNVVPKLWSETNTTVQPQISSKGVKSATGKPNILSGSGNK